MILTVCGPHHLNNKRYPTQALRNAGIARQSQGEVYSHEEKYFICELSQGNLSWGQIRSGVFKYYLEVDGNRYRFANPEKRNKLLSQLRDSKAPITARRIEISELHYRN